MRYCLAAVMSCALPLAAVGQATATAAPTSMPSGSGGSATDYLSYSISASESAIFGYNNTSGPSNSFNISGNAAYVSGSEHHPTSFIYSGGYFVGNNGQPSASFQNLGVSQVLTSRKWTFLASDLVSYLPVAPRYGLAGVPGVGDIGTAPIGTGLGTGDALLSNYGRRLTNSAQIAATYHFTGRTSLQTSGSFTNQTFIGGDPGIDNNQTAAGGELDHVFTRATTLGGAYNYMRFTYPGAGFSFSSQGVSGVYQHTFKPDFTMVLSAGPQWTSSSNPTVIPNRLSLSVSALVNYSMRRTTYSAAYTRGTSAGSGVLYGTRADYVTLAAQRHFSDNWTGGLFLSYSHVNSLTNIASLYTGGTSEVAGVQATRRLGEHWSAYGSYAVQHQSVGQVAATDNAFTGTAQVVSLGITWSPRPIHLGRR